MHNVYTLVVAFTVEVDLRKNHGFPWHHQKGRVTEATRESRKQNAPVPDRLADPVGEHENIVCAVLLDSQWCTSGRMNL